MLRVFRFLALTGMETRALDTRLSLRVWAYGFQCTGYSSNKSNRLPVAYILTTSRIDRLHLTPCYPDWLSKQFLCDAEIIEILKNVSRNPWLRFSKER